LVPAQVEPRSVHRRGAAAHAPAGSWTTGGRPMTRRPPPHRIDAESPYKWQEAARKAERPRHRRKRLAKARTARLAAYAAAKDPLIQVVVEVPMSILDAAAIVAARFRTTRAYVLSRVIETNARLRAERRRMPVETDIDADQLMGDLEQLLPP